MHCGRGGCWTAMVFTHPPLCPSKAASPAYFYIDKILLSHWDLESSPPVSPLAPQNSFQVQCNVPHPSPDRCEHWDGTFKCVLTHHNISKILIHTIDHDLKLVVVSTKWVSWVHSVMECLLVSSEVDGQFGWYTPWLLCSLCIWAYPSCSSGKSRPWRTSSYWQFACSFNFLCGLFQCWAIFIRNCQNVHP